MVSCHTNLDIAPGGLNDYLAQKLELTGVEVLTPTTRDRWYKLVVFVPGGYEDPVRQALGDAGLGIIGRYSHCSFSSPGQGTYRPLPGARPFQGEVGELSARRRFVEVLQAEVGDVHLLGLEVHLRGDDLRVLRRVLGLGLHHLLALPAHLAER